MEFNHGVQFSKSLQSNKGVQLNREDLLQKNVLPNRVAQISQAVAFNKGQFKDDRLSKVVQPNRGVQTT